MVSSGACLTCDGWAIQFVWHDALSPFCLHLACSDQDDQTDSG